MISSSPRSYGDIKRFRRAMCPMGRVSNEPVLSRGDGAERVHGYIISPQEQQTWPVLAIK